jgi:hypothetical protein
MAKVTNAFSTYAAKGNREDLSDAIYNIDPSDRPFMTLIGKRGATNRTFDWQTESLPTLNKANAKEEGILLVNTAGTATVRQTNVCQISSRDATVAASQEASNPAGKRSEMSHQMALIGKALARDQEAILCGEQSRIDGDDAGIARKTRAAEHWIATNVSYGVGGANAVSAITAITDGTQRDFTEGLLANVMQLTYENGGEPNTLLLGPYQKRVFSTFKGRADVRREANENEIIAAVDLYNGDFGVMRALPSRWVRTRTVLGIDPGYFKTASYRKLTSENMAKVGDADTKMLVVEYGLECSNEKAHFKIADLTVTGNTALPAFTPLLDPGADPAPAVSADPPAPSGSAKGGKASSPLA